MIKALNFQSLVQHHSSIITQFGISSSSNHRAQLEFQPHTTTVPLTSHAEHSTHLCGPPPTRLPIFTLRQQTSHLIEPVLKQSLPSPVTRPPRSSSEHLKPALPAPVLCHRTSSQPVSLPLCLITEQLFSLSS
ncbi:hypothetical protein M0R45_036046 [Rubus argutus]|uniref:Uncharacterized protein n=1 Tax=Rubus argutus TaxID=59490 RepID=A0AAW1VUW2_RUBAR